MEGIFFPTMPGTLFAEGNAVVSDYDDLCVIFSHFSKPCHLVLENIWPRFPVEVNMRSSDERQYKRLYSHRNLENLCELIRVGADLDLKDGKGFSFRKFIEENDDSDSGMSFINAKVTRLR